MKVIKGKPSIPSILRIIPLLLVLVLLTWFMVSRGATAVTSLVDSFEDRIWLTTAAFMGLFLLKSVSFGLPFALLYIGVGSIYPFGWALVVNIVGIAINMQIPYFLGRYTGGTFVERLVGKFPRLGRLEAFSQHSSFLFSFMTKFIGKIPHEITNALLGSLRVPYLAYITGGILGLCPTMIATTLVAASLDQIGSPLFYISLVVVVVLTLVSFILYRRFGDTNG
ncbi:TVP38/TMEM64 family protein [Pleomorphochaeta sp. DL1XJH-081]|uniref:TVP38/TMEM64 family protein n=1 Tax=Pleomorphochaeta sp. DL1XJH-081 TaxID=3409690 RepID=UPI003BB7018E